MSRLFNNRPVRLLLTPGDPAGVGPEVLLRALSSLPDGVEATVVGHPADYLRIARRLGACPLRPRIRWTGEAFRFPKGIRPGRVQAAAGRFAYQTLEEAIRRMDRAQADALVTAPVSKEAIVRAGFSWVGHTERLARAFGARAVMMFVTGRFRVALVTTHCALRDLPRRLTRAKVRQTLETVDAALRKDFGIARPRLGLAALNPHAGEGGLFGREEATLLLPALRAFRRKVRSARVTGPLPVDSLARQAALGGFDAVVALYHDQALIPVKLLGWERAVNVTLGLPFVRTSPVHGTAFDLAGRSKAQARSMQQAVRLAVELARRACR